MSRSRSATSLYLSVNVCKRSSESAIAVISSAAALSLLSLRCSKEKIKPNNINQQTEESTIFSLLIEYIHRFFYFTEHKQTFVNKCARKLYDQQLLLKIHSV